MFFSRRHLFRLGQACLAAAAVPARVFAEEPGAGSALADPLLKMTRDSFTPLLRSGFVANSGSTKPTWLTLIAVDDASTPASANSPAGVPKTDAFTLQFQAVGAPLKQGTHQLEHASLGRFALFLVPSGSSAYTATVNHLVGPLPPNYTIPVRKQKAAAPATARIRSRMQSETPAV